MKAQIASLQDQVNALFTSITHSKAPNSLHAASESYPHHDTTPSHRRPISFSSLHTKPPPVHGPISAAYGLDVAKHSLASMGITPETGVEGDPLDQHSPDRAIDPELTAPAQQDNNKDPLWSISREEALRLLQVYDEEIGVTYPMLDMTHVIRHANLLWTFIEAAFRSELMPTFPTPGSDALDDEDTNIMKMILANMLTFEGHGCSEVGDRLFQSVEPHLAKKLTEPADPKSIKLIALAVSTPWPCARNLETDTHLVYVVLSSG